MKIVITILSLLVLKVATAQLNGIQWVLSYDVSVLDFRNDTLTNYAIQPFMPSFLTTANICDSSGNLLYYTNGIYIAGADGNQIENGDSLSPCDWTNQNACCGLDVPQGALFLPMPGSSRYYYLFHMSNDTIGGTRPGNLYYSIVDELGNSGKGEVISKNNIYFKAIFRDGGMTATKHANGRDWWVIIGDVKDTYYKFLLTPNGISDTLIQTIGPSFDNILNIAYSKFSQDGSKYVTTCYQGAVLVMDFDRCTGEFSNPISIFNEGCDSPSTCSGAVAVEFSPSGRFLYASDRIKLNQYDLWSDSIQDSIQLYTASSNDVIQIHFLQLAPNGKLYISTWNGGFYFIHAIDKPDLKGDSCHYVDTAFVTLTANSDNLPNIVNYQLGPLIGSGCDTITDIKQQAQDNKILRVMPNPADKYVYVEMGQQGNYELDLLNEVGQVVDRKETVQVDIFDTEKLPNGVYVLKATDNKNLNNVLTQKVVIQHK